MYAENVDVPRGVVCGAPGLQHDVQDPGRLVHLRNRSRPPSMHNDADRVGADARLAEDERAAAPPDVVQNGESAAAVLAAVGVVDPDDLLEAPGVPSGHPSMMLRMAAMRFSPFLCKLAVLWANMSGGDAWRHGTAAEKAMSSFKMLMARSRKKASFLVQTSLINHDGENSQVWFGISRQMRLLPTTMQALRQHTNL